jgi:hypothetical protein
MPDSSHIPQIDRSRPECVALDNRIKQRRASLARFRQQLQQMQDLEEREEILRNIDSLSQQVDGLMEELAFSACYVIDVPQQNRFIKVVGIEATQSTQYFSLEGTGAAPDNSVRFIEGKQLLVRVYLRNTLSDPMPMSAKLTLHELNPHTLKYDLFRTEITPPLPKVTLAGQAASTRAQLDTTLNFLIPAPECHGNIRLSVLAWADGHENDPVYEAEGVMSPVAFTPTRRPIIHCFRIDFTLTSTTPPTVLAAPSFLQCADTMRLAQRMFPISGMTIIDRGTIQMSGENLITQGDFDLVRAWIQRLRDATIQEDPAGGLILPEENIIYVGMLPDPGGSVWGNALAGSIESVVGRNDLFAHELGHLLLPGHDHIVDTVCANNPTGPLDPSYPDYANTPRTAGIGEFGIDLGVSPPALFNPDTPDIMSYCTNRWISPYNYARALFGEVLSPHHERRIARIGEQKLLISFRLYRDGHAELQSALHLPGPAATRSPKAPTGIMLELLDTGGSMLATAECERSPDLNDAGPYEDFHLAMPWHERARHLVVLHQDKEVARWEVEEPAHERIAARLNCHRQARDNGEGFWRVSWTPAPRENVNFTLRFTPDDGKTWLAVAVGTRSTEIDVDESGLPAGPKCRFQLLTSTGFRTVAEESEEVFLSPRTRQIVIMEPEPGTEVECGNGLRLSGDVALSLGEEHQPLDAFWSSNRDGFIGNGLSVFAQRLSPGRHVLTLTVNNGASGESTAQVRVQVCRPSVRSGEPGIPSVHY